MARPRRSLAKSYKEEGSTDLGKAKGKEIMEDDVVVVSDSTSNASSEEDEYGLRSHALPSSSRKGRAYARGAREQIIQKQGVPNPNTPQKTSGRPLRQRRTTRSPDMAEEVAEVDSDSSGSVFVADENSSSSDDDSSDDDFGGAKRKSRARSGRATLEALDETSEDEVTGGWTQARRPGRGRRAPAKANGRRAKGKSKGKPSVPVQKLGWEVSDDEWNNVWGKATDAEFDSIKLEKLPLEQKDPPAELLMPLLPFQKEWLAWSLKQEAGVMKGGILADEMGMGKTIQAIALIVAGRAIKQSAPKLDLNPPLASSTHGAQTLSNVPKQLPQVKTTLVICPLVAVIQWRNEVSRFTLGGSVKVLIYHGPRRSIGLAELAKYDIVLTTYAIVELEHRKHVLPPKDACQWCCKLFYPDRMTIHQRYFCGPHAQRTAKQARQVKRKNGSEKLETAVSEKEETWDSEDSDEDLKSKKKGKRVAKAKPASSSMKGAGKKLGPKPAGRGRKRKIGEEELEEALLEAVEATKEPEEKASTSDVSTGKSILHSVQWGRIVLDEAHSIKDRRSSTAKAIFALQSEYKWALSGTPLQNRVGELYSLVRFLGIHPFSYYFCRKCDCKSLDYQFGLQGQKCECGHSPLLHFCWWNKFIANPIKRWGYVEEGRKAMLLLKHKVLSNTLLRRTKLERAADLALPPRTAFLRRDAFDAREEDFYQALYTQSQSQFNTYVTAGTLVNNYAHIFDLLTRLRQAVDHPYLVVYSATACKEVPAFASSVAENFCGLCHEPAEDSVTTGCGHSFCRSCIQGCSTADEDLASQCPKCQKPLTVDFTGTKTVANGKDPTAAERGYKRSSILSRIDLSQFQTSTKIDAVREEINSMLEKDPAAKAIIFSQFTSMLDLIGFSLQKAGTKFVKLDGSMSMAARDQMIEAFTNDRDTKVFLMSLKAGGVALNLTVASHVFLMDPWWNPAVEQQAQDRIHRLGQFKPIRVTRFVIENTIEERILKLQEKKQLVFEGTVGGSAEALGRLTEEDLRFLFTN